MPLCASMWALSQWHIERETSQIFRCFQANVSTSALSWNCGEHNDVIVRKILIYFSFEITMTDLDSLFDLMVARLLPSLWVKLFSIAHGLHVLSFSGSILHLKCVGFNWGFDLEDSSSPARIRRALRLSTLLSACIFSITLSLFSTSQLLLPAKCPSPQLTH